MDSAVAALLARQSGVATRWQLLDVVSEARLRTLVRRTRLVPLRRGVYTDQRLVLLDPPARVAVEARAALLLRRRDEVVAGCTAAVLHGLPVLGRLPGTPRLLLPREEGERPREDRPRAWLADDDLVEVDGLQVTSLARTVVDVARTRPFAFALATADAALARGLDPQAALEVVERCRKWPGTLAARRVLALADPRAETAIESLGRARFIEAGLPVPDLQVDLGDAVSAVRVDQYWRRQRTVGEADGLVKYQDREALVAEKLREDRLRDRGEQVVRYVWDEALRRPQVVVDRVLRAFARTARTAA